MADNISVTQGSGTLLTTDQCSSDSSHMEVVKLAYSAAGVRTLIQGDVNGLLVNVSQVQGTVTVAGAVTISGTPAVTVVNAASTTIAVSAPDTAPVSVRLSNGSGNVDTIPISGAVTISGTPGVTVSGNPGVSQSGTWNIGTLTSITNPVTITGTVTVSGGSSVSGTVTANQGTAAAIGNAWYVQLSDGTHANSFTNFSGSYALNVNVLGQVGGGVSQADTSTFTAATTPGTPIEGVFNDSLTAVASGKAAVPRITAYRALHHNLRDSSGNEIGLVGQPLYVQVTGGSQTVNGTVTANQGGAPWSFNQTQINGNAVVTAANGVQTVAVVNSGGVAFSAAAGITAAVALPVQNQPSITGFWRSHATFAVAAAEALHTPAGGKTAFIEGFVITVTTATGTFGLFDNTATDGDFGTYLYYCGAAVAGSIVVTPARPIPLSAINHVLRWTATGSVVGDIAVWGYDA